MIYQLDNLKPVIDKSAYIADSADIIGDVQLAKNVTIWFSAVLRGDIASIIIGENSNVQDNSTIHTDYGVNCVLGKNVTIGHNVILHSCEIDDNVIIGMGSCILNKAKIAKNCVVGANSLVTHKLPYEEGCLIMGQPARIVRKLTAEEIAHIQENADHYKENGKRYQKQLIAC
ncbi:gamma carbonic anhydrase family protein [Zophobihabitans entericus]|uniref:Gamma carbonic anhydrase family protein n=1 Tax=Zophobihabitans entericus TaxID=1635327 RepID=A0A6G9IDJ7_9GAMM|nr:gamma carbonic anhydrase family protein [Zophobihabitans entericus]QIQ21892.1 gamma carbonic anhydrase family protein [Zophobihabitans entericus]